MKRTRVVLVYILFSLSAAVMLCVVAWNGSLQPSQPSIMENTIVSLAFMASCALGIVLSAKPGLLRGKPRESSIGQSAKGVRPSYVAHHPDCGSFEDRVLLVQGKRYCGGCLGLMLGSALAMALMFVYLFVSSPDARKGVLVMFLGMILVALCLMEIAIKQGTQWSHLIANCLLMLGFFLVTVGMISSTGKVVYGLMAIVICFLWLDTRIQFSDWRHARTCNSCGRSCGFY